MSHIKIENGPMKLDILETLVEVIFLQEGRNPLAHEYRLTKNFDGGNIFASAIKQGGEPWRQRIRFNKDFGEKSSGYIGISRCSGNPKSTTFEFGFNSEF